MNTVPPLENRLHAMIDAIEKACANSGEGRPAELSDMKLEADHICAEIVALPPADARALQPLIGDLITRLDELEHRLTDIKNGTGP